MSKILIVGAGLSGAVIARELADAGHTVDIIDSRDHIAGNMYDYVDENGIRVHKYGPHIFHTNNLNVFNWLSDYTEWIPYQHKVKALLADGQYVTLPVNKETQEIVGKDNIIDTLFRPYTKKMWDKDIEELDPSILKRVPIRDDMNELYFPNDAYQYLPKDGYTKLFENILNNENITIHLNKPYVNEMSDDYDFTFNSMPIDQYFDFIYGQLPYRSIKFHTSTVLCPRLLPVPCVNFTHQEKYTRMTEWKLFPNHGENPGLTTITVEEPCDYTDNNLERYYPVKDLEGINRKVYKQYVKLIPDNMEFIGRTGLYVYIDMDQACASALATVKRFLSR